MSEPRRSKRLKSALPSLAPSSQIMISPSSATCSAQLSTPNIKIFLVGSELPGLTPSELRLLRKRQRQLATTATSTLDSLPGRAYHRNALESSLVFAQHEAGSAICIDLHGWILTCFYCIGESEEEWTTNRRTWLLSYTGTAVQAECRAWNSRRDLRSSRSLLLSQVKSKNVIRLHLASHRLLWMIHQTRSPSYVSGSQVAKTWSLRPINAPSITWLRYLEARTAVWYVVLILTIIRRLVPSSTTRGRTGATQEYLCFARWMER